PTSAAIGENIDPAGAGIDGVFDQFLDHARRAFHHLAGGNAVDDLFRELADGHGVWVADSGGRGDSTRADVPGILRPNLVAGGRTEIPPGRLYGTSTQSSLGESK